MLFFYFKGFLKSSLQEDSVDVMISSSKASKVTQFWVDSVLSMFQLMSSVNSSLFSYKKAFVSKSFQTFQQLDKVCTNSAMKLWSSMPGRNYWHRIESQRYDHILDFQQPSLLDWKLRNADLGKSLERKSTFGSWWQWLFNGTRWSRALPWTLSRLTDSVGVSVWVRAGPAARVQAV